MQKPQESLLSFDYYTFYTYFPYETSIHNYVQLYVSCKRPCLSGGAHLQAQHLGA